MTYAEEIECRIIHTSYAPNSYTQGRLTLEHIWLNGVRIGGTVRFKDRPEDFILKCFADGLAFFYPSKLCVFNGPTNSAIKAVILKHYKIIKRLRTEHGNLDILQYQLLPQSLEYVTRTENFADYLASKYNLKGDSL